MRVFFYLTDFSLRQLRIRSVHFALKSLPYVTLAKHVKFLETVQERSNADRSWAGQRATYALYKIWLYMLTVSKCLDSFKCPPKKTIVLIIRVCGYQPRCRCREQTILSCLTGSSGRKDSFQPQQKTNVRAFVSWLSLAPQKKLYRMDTMICHCLHQSIDELYHTRTMVATMWEGRRLRSGSDDSILFHDL